jgi:hypothetical protein
LILTGKTEHSLPISIPEKPDILKNMENLANNCGKVATGSLVFALVNAIDVLRGAEAPHIDLRQLL